MAFTPKDWKDYPDTSTPITAAALEDMETRLSSYTDTRVAALVFNVKDYGAVGDGSTDDTSAITSAIAALPTNGGTVFFPPGTYKITSSINIDNKRSVRFVGSGGMSSGAGTATILQYTTGDSAKVISARSTAGCALENLYLYANNASFTGTLLDLSWSSANADTAQFTIRDCQLACASTSSTTLVNLDRAIICRFYSVFFSSAAYHVKGITNASGRYSNAHQFHSCLFQGQGTTSVLNPGEGWLFNGCTWEGDGGSVKPAIDYDASSYVYGKGVVLQGCWLGDFAAGAGKGYWIAAAGYGWTITGCHFSGGEYAIKLGTSTTSVQDALIAGNYFAGALTNVILGVVSSPDISKNWLIMANAAPSVTGQFVGYGAGMAAPDSSLIQNQSTGTTVGTNLIPFGFLARKSSASSGISDSDFAATPPPGTLVLDSANNRLYVRVGSTWKYAALT